MIDTVAGDRAMQGPWDVGHVVGSDTLSISNSTIRWVEGDLIKIVNLIGGNDEITVTDGSIVTGYIMGDVITSAGVTAGDDVIVADKGTNITGSISNTVKHGAVAGELSTGIDVIAGNDEITINNATVANSVYGELVTSGNITTSGNDKVHLKNSANITGNIELDTAKANRGDNGGSDWLYWYKDTNAATVSGNISGGDDRTTTDGSTDTFALAEYNGSIQNFETALSSKIVSFEDFAITSGSTVEYGSAYTSAEFVNYHIDDTSTAKMHGGGNGVYNINADLHNNGIIDMADGSVGDQLSAVSVAPSGSATDESAYEGSEGNYTGGGKIKIDVDFTAQKSDKLIVAGDTANKTELIVNETTTAPDANYEVLVVDVAGKTADGDFTLAGGTMKGSSTNFDYKLERRLTKWYLVVKVKPQSVDPKPVASKPVEKVPSTSLIALLAMFTGLVSLVGLRKKKA